MPLIVPLGVSHAARSVYETVRVMYGLVRSGWTKVIGTMKIGRMFACSYTDVASSMLASVGTSFATLVAAVPGDAPWWSSRSY